MITVYLICLTQSLCSDQGIPPFTNVPDALADYTDRFRVPFTTIREVYQYAVCIDRHSGSSIYY